MRSLRAGQSWHGSHNSSCPSHPRKKSGPPKSGSSGAITSTKVSTKEYLVSYEADEHEIIKHKKSLPSYPRLKTAGKMRAWFLGTPIVLLIAYGVLVVSTRHTEHADDVPEANNQEQVAVETPSPKWFENPVLQH